jgi:hypothetical protein
MHHSKRLQSAMTDTVKLTFGRRRLVIREVRNKLLLWPSALATRRIENAEINRLTAQIPQRTAAKVATIIPSYGRPALLQCAVQSALAQTVDDQIVLVVDDGGGLPCLPADPRLHAASLSANIGTLGVVRNIGIRLTSSQYVAFLDDDNEWEPRHLEVALNALSTAPGRPGPGLAYTAIRRSFPSGEYLDTISISFDRRLLARDSYIDSNSLVIKRFPGLHFSRIRRDLGVRPREDWELAYRLSRTIKAVHVDEPTVRYRVNPDSYYTDWSALGTATPNTATQQE